MKYPLDKVCVKSGVFCSSCQRKIEAGIVSEDDIQVLRALVNLENKLKFLKKGEYVKSINIGEESVVLVRDEFDQSEIDILEKELSNLMDRKVKVIEYVNDLKKLIEQIISPATLLGLNKIWLPTGEEIINVRISARDRRIIGKNRELYEQLIEKISGLKTRIVFE
ncbi:MAG: transcription elongation factor [Desulfurococcaceae archaeon]